MRLKRNQLSLWLALGGVAAVSIISSLAWAQSTVSSAPVASAAPSSGANEGMSEDNPAGFWVSNGEQLWSEPQGPKHVSLAKTCNLGLGVGVVKGAYVQLPRYFADTREVQDLESRLLTCMVSGQGLNRASIIKDLNGTGGNMSTMASVATYVASQSDGMPMNVSLRLPQEQQAYDMGKRIFYYRSAPYDFSCAACHSENGKRVRLQAVPNFAVAGPDVRKSYPQWPAYRLSKGEVVTFDMRLIGCFRQMRMPKVEYASPAEIDLAMFIARNSNGGKVTAPGLTQ